MFCFVWGLASNHVTIMIVQLFYIQAQREVRNYRAQPKNRESRKQDKTDRMESDDSTSLKLETL